MITFAKGVNSGTVPMGGVVVRKGIYDTFMKGPENMIELFHGYTYSGHPLACASALAAQDIYRDEKLFERAKTLEPVWADAMHGLKEPAQRARHPHHRPRRRHRPRLAARTPSAPAPSRRWTAASTRTA